jgi:two-component system response regulator ChvI
VEEQLEIILVVDDDRIVLEVLQRVLEREGIEAHCVLSGEEAVEQVMKKDFSLMITDLCMPGMDGFELTRKVLEIAPQMPVIMDTGSISPKIIRQAKEIGISEVLAKPFHLKEMLNTIREVLRTGRVYA